jgi:hypothetical protein
MCFFIAIGTKKTLKIQKTNKCKNATVQIPSPPSCADMSKKLIKAKKKKKKPNFEKAVSGRLPILLTTNQRLTVAVSKIY